MHIEIVRLKDVREGEHVVPISSLEKSIKAAKNSRNPKEEVGVVIIVNGKKLMIPSGSVINSNSKLLVLRLCESSSQHV